MAASNSSKEKSRDHKSLTWIIIGGLSLWGGFSFFSGSFFSYSAPGSHEHNGVKINGIEFGSPPEDDPAAIQQGAADIKRLEDLHKRMDDNGWDPN